MQIHAETSRLFEDEIVHPTRKCGVIHVGTSGFSFDDWRGAFYPRKLPRSQWLEFYSSQFAAVEINATYYRLPRPEVFGAMAERTPDEFEFWVKVPGETTHGFEPVKPVVQKFLKAVAPLNDSGKLKGALAQFPNSFRPGHTSRTRLQQIREAIAELPLAIEFRHRDWQSEETFDFLTTNQMTYVIPDLPELPGLPDNTVRTIGRTSYVRLHGRNSRTWYDQKQGDRYDYEYRPEEVKKWRDCILQIDQMAESTYVFFNNCHAGQAVKNARMLRQLLLS